MTTLTQEATVVGITVPTGLFIAGQWRDIQRQSRFDVHDPATGAVIAHIADATTHDALDALDAAAAAQNSWGSRSPRSRGEILRKAYALITSHREGIAAITIA